MSASITIGIDPTFALGPLEVSWHGLMSALGIVAGAWLAAKYCKERGLETDSLFTAIIVAAIAGVVGAKLLNLLQHDPDAVIRPTEWIENQGYSIYGGLLAGGVAATVYLRRQGRSLLYLDVMAAGLPLGMAVGRVGDLIYGEHYGSPTDLPWGIIYSHPESPVPSNQIAYHPGGLYEIVLSLAILAVLWPHRSRFVRPTALLWTTAGLYGAGRFAMFFWREDASTGVGGINSAQLESLVLVLVALIALLALRRSPQSGQPA